MRSPSADSESVSSSVAASRGRCGSTRVQVRRCRYPAGISMARSWVRGTTPRPMGMTTPSAEGSAGVSAGAWTEGVFLVPVSGARASARRMRAPSQRAGVRMRWPRSRARDSRRLRCWGRRPSAMVAPMRRVSTPSSSVEVTVRVEASSRRGAGIVRTRLRSRPTSVAAHQPSSSPPMTPHQPVAPWRRARAARRRVVDPWRVRTPESWQAESTVGGAGDAEEPA